MKKSFLLAFIGGSGIYQIEDLKNKKWINVNTPWGKPSDKILTGIVNNRKVLFLPRHGRNHIYNPSEINYRANIYALKKLGATDIISLSACGSLKERLSPGTFVLVDQFIDKTLIRKKTFFEEGIVAHVSMANPTSEILRNACEEVLKKLKIKYQRRGTYLAMEGPQFSSKAESESYRKQKIDVIGMTNMPEAN